MMQVTVKALRHYEQKGLLVPDEVDEWTGYRYYSIAQMQRLGTIRGLQRQGFTLEEIKELLEEGAQMPSIDLLTQKIEETERQLQLLMERREQLQRWVDSHKQRMTMEKFSIQSLPEIIVASHREVIPDYSALGMLCVNKIGPEMQRLGTIRGLQRQGFTLDEIKELLEEGAQMPSIDLLTQKIAETERQLQLLMERRTPLLRWMDSHKQRRRME